MRFLLVKYVQENLLRRTGTMEKESNDQAEGSASDSWAALPDTPWHGVMSYLRRRTTGSVTLRHVYHKSLSMRICLYVTFTFPSFRNSRCVKYEPRERRWMTWNPPKQRQPFQAHSCTHCCTALLALFPCTRSIWRSHSAYSCHFFPLVLPTWLLSSPNLLNTTYF